ncbi:hypothetical protein FACS18949_11680 [Clostridia bacterium]|nr:hypothetical protein FACS189425_06570 [Clostridia bacterium]GHV34861.1 hypothetical protein FACS18949_11680 [Clostridia bacterium]
MTVHFSIDDVSEVSFSGKVQLFESLTYLYEKYNLKSTCYCYGRDIPKKQARIKDYIKFGFHSEDEQPFKDDIYYKKHFKLATRKLRRFSTVTDFLRLHYWDATDEQLKFLYKMGVKRLHTREPTVRFENISDLMPQSLHIGNEQVFAFTHEWCLDEQRAKVEEALEMYLAAGYNFIN